MLTLTYTLLFKATMTNLIFILGCDLWNIIHLLSSIVDTNIWVRTPATSAWSQGKRVASFGGRGGAPFQSDHFKLHTIQSKYSKTRGRFQGAFKTPLRARRRISSNMLSSVMGTNMWGFEGGPPWHGREGKVKVQTISILKCGKQSSYCVCN